LREKGIPIIRFHGPDSVDYKKAKAINDAAWAEAIKSGRFE
jgi:hypothetical protein